MAWQAAVAIAGASLAGGILGQKNQRKMQEKEIEAQREFAQHGIRWRVADAEAAGIHPLYAVNANTPTYTPTRVGTGGDPLARGIRQAGQAVGS